MYSNLRSLIFKLEPESAHGLTLQIMRLVGALPGLGLAISKVLGTTKKEGNPPIKILDLKFPNPVGLAAGYDKDGLGWRGLAFLGFGHLEIGTVTPRPQPGNPKPRVFRLPEDKGLINRLGFPGKGADFVAHRLRGKRPRNIILGVNIGKNKDTPNEQAGQDYLHLLKMFSPLADYIAINVSSPNTVGLRSLQARRELENLLTQLDNQRKNDAHESNRHIPLLVKLAPDLTPDELDDSLTAIMNTGMDGVIATNTTIQRNGLQSFNAHETGGLSGTPLTERSNQMVKDIYKRTEGKLPIIGVGGIMSSEDAKARLQAGASLIQIYTGLIYAGPGLVKQILRTIYE